MNEIKQEALEELKRVKSNYQQFIRDNFEFAAADCRTCPTPGHCCTDAHFVNVHITRLEAVAIKEMLAQKLTANELKTVYERVQAAIEKYNLKSEGETFAQTFACPLFEPNVGCLIHAEGAKPAPCIQHACYEQKEDLPPQCLQDYAHDRVEKLNREVYGENWQWLPLPLQLIKVTFGDEK